METTVCENRSMPKERTKEDKNAKQKRKNHISARFAHLRYHNSCRRSKFFQGEIERGSGPSFSFFIGSRISGQVNVKLFKQLRSSWEANQLSCF